MTALSPTSVYRYYDRDGLLIYVGITSRGARRNYEHNTSKDWWPYVARQEVDHYETRALALRHERSLIIRHRPPFNRQHNPDADATRAVYVAYADATEADALGAWRAAKKRMTFKMHEVHPKLRTLTLVNELGSAWLAQHIRSGDEFPIFHTRGRNRLKVGDADVVSAGLEEMSYFITLRFARHVPLFQSAFARVRVVSLKKPMVFRIATLNCAWETYEARQGRAASASGDASEVAS